MNKISTSLLFVIMFNFTSKGLCDEIQSSSRIQEPAHFRSRAVNRVTQATAAQFDVRSLNKDANGLYILTSGEHREACPDQGIPSHNALLSHCTSSLVGPDLLVTAAHCVPRGCGNGNLRFVFNVTSTKTKVSEDEMYKCQEVYKDHYLENDSRTDIAIIKLDREVPGIRPLIYDPQNCRPGLNSVVYSVGHPSRHPLVASRGQVQNIDPNTGSFSSSLFVDHGMSGAPVFTEDGCLVGVNATINLSVKQEYQAWYAAAIGRKVNNLATLTKKQTEAPENMRYINDGDTDTSKGIDPTTTPISADREETNSSSMQPAEGTRMMFSTNLTREDFYCGHELIARPPAELQTFGVQRSPDGNTQFQGSGHTSITLVAAKIDQLSGRSATTNESPEIHSLGTPVNAGR